MHAVLLCAGFATRLYPLTRDFPKPLLPVGGRPLLDYLMDQIARLPGIDEIHIVTNAKYSARFNLWRPTSNNLFELRCKCVLTRTDFRNTITGITIKSIIYSEISLGFSRIEDLRTAIDKAGFHMLDFPREALFLAGKAFLAYKKSKGAGNAPLPDFFIGTHAAVLMFP